MLNAIVLQYTLCHYAIILDPEPCVDVSKFVLPDFCISKIHITLHATQLFRFDIMQGPCKDSTSGVWAIAWRVPSDIQPPHPGLFFTSFFSCLLQRYFYMFSNLYSIPPPPCLARMPRAGTMLVKF